MSISRIVVKVGGRLAEDIEQADALAKDLVILLERGHQLIVVHGGGPQATALTTRLGLEPNIVGGRRVTDEPTLEVVKMVLAGQVSVGLTARLCAGGVPAVGLSGVSAGLISAVKRPPRVVSGGGDAPVDFGYVGDIVAIRAEVILPLLSAGFVPVMNSLGSDERGQVYNINADIAATRVAQAVGATLVLTTGGVRGVLRDKDDDTTRIPLLTPHQAREAIVSGVIVGGMIPKIEESLNVLGDGVRAIHILGRLRAGDLLTELATPGAVGTALVQTPEGRP